MVQRKILETALAELQSMEEQLTRAAERYEHALADLTMAAKKYAAIRDFITEDELWDSPYAPQLWGDWPEYPEKGTWRYINLKPGEAAATYLRLAKTPTSLWDIWQQITDAGFGYPNPPDARSLNAALINTRNIVRNEPTGEKGSQPTFEYDHKRWEAEKGSAAVS